jgi:hypothetical protein
VIVVAQFIWVAALLASAIAIAWIVSRLAALLNRAEEIYDRADQILSGAQPPARPLPTPGPATVPTTVAIDIGHRALTTGRHARSE